MKYRPEIDGLRALAVIPVMLFHAGFEIFSGGYVGVDVFFEISGYLITTILIEDIENKRFNLVHFYERRARRILPALFLVMLVCIPFAWMWMPPSQMKDFGQSLIAVSFFVSNILFWRESGYFDEAAEEKPLLHTWSLAVEGQYYILFPLFLLLAWRFGKDRVFWMIVVMTVISLALSEWGWRYWPTANFYFAPTRAWELLAGSIAAFIIQKYGVRANNVLSTLGLAAIVFALLIYDENTPFPSLYALVPVLGVVSLILFADKETAAAKLLGSKIFVGIGLISYSAYLWHQPLFAFARLQATNENTAIVMLGLSALSLLLAYVSWRFVEQPFRKKQRVSQNTMLLLSGLTLTLFLGVGVWGTYKNGYLNPAYTLAPNVQWRSLGEKIKSVGNVCDRGLKISGTKYIIGCEFGSLDSPKTVILMGDSHSMSISHYLNDALKARDIRGLYLGIEGCEPIPYIRQDKDISVTNCDERFDELLAFLHEKKSPAIILNRWTFRLYPIEGFIEMMPYRNSLGDEEKAEYREYHVLSEGKFYADATSKREALEKFLIKLSSVSTPLFLIYPVPETAIDIEEKNRLYYGKNGDVLSDIYIPVSDYHQRNKFVVETFDSIVETHPIIPIKTEGLLCDHKKCTVQEKSIPLYYDNNHLSYEGSKLIVDAILKKLN